MSSNSPGPPEPGRFRVIEQVGTGAYGDVYKVLDIDENKTFAFKSVRKFDEHEGVPLAFYREERVLSQISHRNIVSFHGTVRIFDELFIKLEFCETDLQKQLEAMVVLDPLQVKSLFFQLISGLAVIHESGFSHRDIKPANLLIKNGLELKIADFGLSRSMAGRRFTSRVVALAYRAPELILGSKFYTNSVDIWSAGVILYELATGKHFPSAPAELVQLSKIFQLCGTPDSNSSLSDLPQFQLAAMIQSYPRVLEQVLLDSIPSELSGAAELISRMLSLEPGQRPSAAEILNDPFFDNMSIPEPLSIPERGILSREISPRSPPVRPAPLLLEVA